VIAPAGFGKTTLVAASLTDCPLLVAWLSLDKDDNQVERFLIYLLAALQSVDPQVGKEAAHLMTGMQLASPEAVLTHVINDLDYNHTEMVLVLDDYQFISNDIVHQILAFLIEHCPSTLHLLIVTRSDPPLPLARLRARGQMVELRANDLRFTPGEAVEFLNQVMGLSIDDHWAAVLDERTEGWVAGLQMAALSLRDRRDVAKFVQDFSGTNRHILDYLLEEVLAGQSPEVQRFLLYTSILNRLTGPLCDAILAETKDPSLISVPSSTSIEYLGRENLFLVALDDERTWYRYHHLFQDLLRARLQQSQADIIPNLHKSASTWLERHGFIPEAIKHLIAAQEMDLAANLIECYGPVHWAEGDASVVQMSDRLPLEMLIAKPKLGLYHAWLLVNQANIEKAVPLLKDLKQYLSTVESHPGYRWIQTIVKLTMTFLFPQTDTSGSDLFPDYELLEEIPAGELVMRDVADVLYGMTLGRRGEIDRVIEVAIRCIQREKANQSPLAVPSIGPYLAFTYLELGRLHAAASLCNEYLQVIKDTDSHYIAAPGCLNVILGVALYEWNRLDEAEQQIRKGLQENEPWQAVVPDGFGLGTLTRVLLAKGNYAGAMQIVDKFETRFQSPTRPVEFQEAFHTLRVCVEFASGDFQKAFQWAEEIQQSEDFHLHPGDFRPTLARIYLAQGRYPEVEKMLREMPSYRQAVYRTTRHIEFDLLRAAAIAGQNRLPEAFELLGACLALTEPEGNMRIYLDIGEPVKELLAAYLLSAATDNKAYAQKLLDAFSPVDRARLPRPQPAGLAEPLSGRELEVLQLIALGKTNEEIAKQLFISTGTVKAHTSSIYGKLDVANRTEAVARARQLGLFA
jgi:LuxR family maltose regulon positive regulatory protein